MIYLSFLIYPYAVHSPVPRSLIQSPYQWAYTDGSHVDELFLNHLAQCLSLFKPVWWALQLLWLPLTECNNVLTDICKVFMLLFHYCILLEIRLRTIATATAIAAAACATGAAGAGACVAAATATVYMIEDAGTCTFTQPLVVFRLQLHPYPIC